MNAINKNVSIPNGTIKRKKVEHSAYVYTVSIPNGTIKSDCRYKSQTDYERFNSKWYD